MIMRIDFAARATKSAHLSIINVTIRSVMKAIDAAAGPLGMDSYPEIIYFTY